MQLEHFNDLLLAARSQPQSQRLLLLFATAELPDDCTPQQRADFEAGHGGALVPAMCVDKDPQELASFAALADEARQMGAPWHMVFVSTLSGAAGKPPAQDRVETALNHMVSALQQGAIGNMLPFNREGDAVSLAG